MWNNPVHMRYGSRFRFIIVTSFITCMMFVGFAEIIDLLQASKEQQKEILAYLKKRESKERNAHRTVIQDIESNLPEM